MAPTGVGEMGEMLISIGLTDAAIILIGCTHKFDWLNTSVLNGVE